MTTTDFETAAEGLLIMPETEDKVTDEAPLEEAPELDDQDQEAEGSEDDVDPAEAEETDVEDADEADEEDGGDEQPSVFTVKVDGQDVEVTLDDLTRSYSGQAYIQKGMQEAADARKQVEQEKASLQAEQQRFVETIQRLQQEGVKQAPQAPDVSMLDTDPIGYMQADAKYKAEKAAYEQQQEQLTAMQTQRHQQYLQEQKRELAARVPEFANPETARPLMEKLVDTGVKGYGFSAEEIGAVTDARTVQVLMDAMRWRDLQEGKVEAKKKPTPPKAIKPTGRRTQPTEVTRQKLKAQAKKTQSADDWVNLLLEPKNG